MISDNLAEAARQYASQGWHVFPCSARSKLPTAGTRGFHDATDSVDDVVAIWRERPTLNVSVALGASGLLAVDIETSEHEWLERLPETWTQRTPGGGWHFLYRQPAGTPIPSVPLGQLAGDVEIKGDGGYVLLAPSRAASKKLGNAVGAYSVAHEVPPQDAPQWLVDMVRARESQRRRAAASVFSSVRVGGGAVDRIASLIADLRAAPEGGRNQRRMPRRGYRRQWRRGATRARITHASVEDWRTGIRRRRGIRTSRRSRPRTMRGSRR